MVFFVFLNWIPCIFAGCVNVDTDVWSASLLCAGSGKPMLSLTNRLNFLGVIYFPSEIFLLRTASQTVQRNLGYKGSARSLCVIVDAESASLLCAGAGKPTLAPTKPRGRLVC